MCVCVYIYIYVYIHKIIYNIYTQMLAKLHTHLNMCICMCDNIITS